MIILLPVIVGIVIALLQGGSLRLLAALPIRVVWAILLSFALQAAVYVIAVQDPEAVHKAGRAVYVAAMGLVLFGVGRNWHLGAPARLILLGLALNCAAIMANGGRMPVDVAALRSTEGAAQAAALVADDPLYYNREPATGSSRLNALSDQIRVALPADHGCVCSIGDLLLAGGAGWLVWGATRRRRSAPTCEDAHVSGLDHGPLGAPATQ